MVGQVREHDEETRDDIIDLPFDLRVRYDALRDIIREYGSLAVAFSGGVDSTLLAKVAHDTLSNRMIAISSSGPATPQAVIEQARAWAQGEGIRHFVIVSDELSVPEFVANTPDRCYHCKRKLFEDMGRVAKDAGCAILADGSNVDDQGDYRPGLRALVELGVVSPLREAGFTKGDVRSLSHALNLPTWNAPSAACLASRFAYGERITREKLRRVEQAEDYLHGLGLVQLRVRVHGEHAELARIEVNQEDIARLAAPDVREAVVGHLRDYGFTYVSLDLSGFRSGAMNEVLPE